MLPTRHEKQYAIVVRQVHILDSEKPENYWNRLTQESLELMFKQTPGCIADESWIDQDLVEGAASIRGRRVTEFLFTCANRRGKTIAVTKTMVIVAAKNTIYGHAIFQFLAELTSQQLPVDDEKVLQTAAAQGNLKTITFFLGEPQYFYSFEFFVAAASNPDLNVVEFLFRDIDAVDTVILEAAAGNSDAVLDCLLLKRHKQIDWHRVSLMVAKCCRRTSSLDHVLSLDRPVKSEGDQMRSQKNEELITVAANGGEAPGALRMLLVCVISLPGCVDTFPNMKFN